MGRWKIFAAVATTLLVGGGAQLAWAQGQPDVVVGSDVAATNAIGGGTSESKYVALTPCRIVDTRQAGGQLGVGSSRSFDVRGSGGTFAAQGGLANGCSIPDSATAIEATVTAIDGDSGFLRIWPAGQGQPNATFMNYGGTVNLSNTGAVSLCASSCSGTADIVGRAFGNSTHLVIDVQGYYQAPMAAAVHADGTLTRGSRVVATARTGQGTYLVTFDRDITDCIAQASLHSVVAEVATNVLVGTSHQVLVNTGTSDGTGSADRRFDLLVSC